jgi:hypothetical protein
MSESRSDAEQRHVDELNALLIEVAGLRVLR